MLTCAVESYPTPGDTDDSSSPTPPTYRGSYLVKDSSIEVFLYAIHPSLPWSISASVIYNTTFLLPSLYIPFRLLFYDMAKVAQ